MFLSRCAGRDRIIVDVSKRFSAGSRIGRELMDGRERDSRIVRNDIFRAVAMMRIKIPNGDTLSVVFQSIERGDRDVAEITKAHGAIARGVMSRWPHQAESALALQRCTCGTDGGAGRAQSVIVDVWIDRRVGIEVARRFPYSVDVFARVRAQEFFTRGRPRLTPFPSTMSILQQRDRARDSRRSLGVAGSGILGAAWVVKNDHRSASCPIHSIGSTFWFVDCFLWTGQCKGGRCLTGKRLSW